MGIHPTQEERMNVKLAELLNERFMSVFDPERLEEQRRQVDDRHEGRLKKVNELHRRAVYLVTCFSVQEKYEWGQESSNRDLISAYECVVVMGQWLGTHGLSVAESLARDLLESEGRPVEA